MGFLFSVQRVRARVQITFHRRGPMIGSRSLRVILLLYTACTPVGCRQAGRGVERRPEMGADQRGLSLSSGTIIGCTSRSPSIPDTSCPRMVGVTSGSYASLRLCKPVLKYVGICMVYTHDRRRQAQTIASQQKLIWLESCSQKCPWIFSTFFLYYRKFTVLQLVLFCSLLVRLFSLFSPCIGFLIHINDSSNVSQVPALILPLNIQAMCAGQITFLFRNT